jgi:hypothetical protein
MLRRGENRDQVCLKKNSGEVMRLRWNASFSYMSRVLPNLKSPPRQKVVKPGHNRT